MAFYKDFEKKTRSDKRQAAFSRGGFSDEGSEYKKGDRNRSSFGKRSEGGFARTENKDPKKRYLDGKNGYGEHMPRNQKPAGSFQKNGKDKPSYEKSRYERPERSERPAPRKDFAPKGREEAYDRYRYAQPAQYGSPMDDDGDVVPMENLLSGRNPMRSAQERPRH